MSLPYVLVVSAAFLGGQARADTVLGIQGDRFTLNGTPAFLLGFSYYSALGADEKTVGADLDEMRQLGVNWIRVWATWAAFDHDVSAVDREGRPREMHLKKLAWLVAECDRRGMVVDVTLSRGNGVTGPKRLQTLEAHERAVTAIVGTLKPHRNWYIDLGNERSIKDARFVSFADLKTLRALVRKLDPARLVTASSAGDIPQAEIKDYLDTGIDFLAPHRPRQATSAAQTEAMTRSYRTWLKDAGRVVPVHYQEPFRRGFGKYDPSADDFWTDLQGARKGGAAGWCFHNGDQRARKDGRPRSSFDLRDGRLFEQLDETERAFLKRLK
jgi:endo-1,4-beta-mannosidase